MHFDLLQSLSLCGDLATPNDDRAGADARRAWVIDGATDLGPPGLLGDQGAAAWLAAAADAAFGAAGGHALRDACAQVFGAVAARYADERRRPTEDTWELPCASFAAVQLGDAAIEIGWAGDCALLHRHGTDTGWLTPAPDRVRESAAAAALGSGVGAQKMRAPAVIADRRAARGRSGRKVLGVDAHASMQATAFAHTPIAPGDELLLMSDGFVALVDAYAAYDGAGLFDAVHARGLAALATELRAIEHEDAGCTRFPRFKASDDATSLWLRVGG